MATQIKETPILTGKDARKFLNSMKNIKLKDKDYKRMIQNYNEFKCIFKDLWKY